jgi:hypothetical protein
MQWLVRQEALVNHPLLIVVYFYIASSLVFLQKRSWTLIPFCLELPKSNDTREPEVKAEAAEKSEPFHRAVRFWDSFCSPNLMVGSFLNFRDAVKIADVAYVLYCALMLHLWAMIRLVTGEGVRDKRRRVGNSFVVCSIEGAIQQTMNDKPGFVGKLKNYG